MLWHYCEEYDHARLFTMLTESRHAPTMFYQQPQRIHFIRKFNRSTT
ncbi:hypothetical protein JW998_02055 [candidate division KSB1 bacterium]|nr:hypothetical protein [candidate division KSB1 bacterium]